MATSGKKKKTQWRPMQNNNLIEISAPRKVTSSWAEEVDKEIEVDSYDVKPMEKVVLPTAPRASCAVPIDESKVPHSGPFQAYVSNIPYDLTTEELKSYFSDLNIKDVRLPREDKGSNRAKGFGYVEFMDRGSLISALGKGETMLKGRAIHIELSTNDSGRGGRNRGSQRSDSRGDASSVDRTSVNWRSGPRADDSDDRGFQRKEYGGSGGSFSRRDDKGESFDRYSRDRDRESSFHREDRNREDKFDRGFGFSDKGYRERGFQDDDSSFGRRDERNYGRDDRFGRQDFKERFPLRRDESRESSEPKTRTKLVLQPRSTNLPTNELPIVASQSIFGNAKPVDTATKLREIEERLAKIDFPSSSVASSDKARGAGSSTSNGSGSMYVRSDTEKKIEPAPPPKENPWGPKSRITNPVVNNGRNSPVDETEPPSDSLYEDKKQEEEKRPRPDKKVDNRRLEDSKSEKFAKGAMRPSAPPSDKRPSAVSTAKHRESKKDLDDVSKMPKVADAQAPNFAVTNKFSSLVENEDGGTE